MTFWRKLNTPKPAPPSKRVNPDSKTSVKYKARTFNPDKRTDFPYGLYKTRKTDPYSEDVDELKDETLEFINLIGALGADEAVQNPFQYNIFQSEQVIHFTDDPGDLADDEEENPAHLTDECDNEEPAPKLLTIKQEKTDNNRGCPSVQDTNNDSKCELHSMSPSLVPRIPLPTTNNKQPSVVSYILKSPEENYISRVKDELGYEFSSLLGGFVEEMVHEKWAESREKGCLLDESEVISDIHSLVVDAQVKLARHIERYFDKLAQSADSRRLLAVKDAAREIFGHHHSDIESTSSESSSESDDSSSEISDNQSGMRSENVTSNSSESDSTTTTTSTDSDDIILASSDEDERDCTSDNSKLTSSVGVLTPSAETAVGAKTRQQISPRKLKGCVLQNLDVTKFMKRTSSTPCKHPLSSSDSDSNDSNSLISDREQKSPKRRKLFHSQKQDESTQRRYQTRSRTRSQSSVM